MSADRSESIVTYVPMRPVGGSSLRVVAIIGAFGLATLLIGVIALHQDLVIVGVMVSIVCVPLTSLLFIAHASRLAPIDRRLYPYRGLERQPHDGGRLIGGGSYLADDHLAAVLFDSSLPVVGKAFYYDTTSPDYWRRLSELLKSHGVAIPRAIADERLKPQLTGIPLTHDLLEPEPVVAGKAVGGKVHVTLVVLYLLLASAIAIFFGVNRFHAGWVYMFFALSLLGSTPPIRRLLRNHRWEHNAPIAGCGVIQFPNRKRWTCHDAVMLVLPASLAGGISVCILGEAGICRLGFANTADADFITLWERWNHLNPQPDLLE